MFVTPGRLHRQVLPFLRLPLPPSDWESGQRDRRSSRKTSYDGSFFHQSRHVIEVGRGSPRDLTLDVMVLHSLTRKYGDLDLTPPHTVGLSPRIYTEGIVGGVYSRY